MPRPPNIWTDDAQLVDEKTIQAKFNAARVWERIQRGDLIPNIIKDKHPSRTKAREPFCTRSQLVAYFLPDRTPVAVVHRYLRTDGTLGASGKPDPVRFFDGWTVFAKAVSSSK